MRTGSFSTLGPVTNLVVLLKVGSAESYPPDHDPLQPAGAKVGPYDGKIRFHSRRRTSVMMPSTAV